MTGEESDDTDEDARESSRLEKLLDVVVELFDFL